MPSIDSEDFFKLLMTFSFKSNKEIQTISWLFNGTIHQFKSSHIVVVSLQSLAVFQQN